MLFSLVLGGHVASRLGHTCFYLLFCFLKSASYNLKTNVCFVGTLQLVDTQMYSRPGSRHWECVGTANKTPGRGNSPGGKVLVIPALGPEFNSQDPHGRSQVRSL